MTTNGVQRTLVLSPHPDDESLACGGTLRLMASDGARIDVLYMTSGENGFLPHVTPTPEQSKDLAAKRQAEARQACDILGVERVEFLPGRDGQLNTQPELAETILAAFAAYHYRSVFCPWPLDAHGDHMATYAMLHRALARHSENVEVWLYEVWQPVAANKFIRIDMSIDAKMQAFKAHKSQASLLNYAEAFHGLARYRSLFCPPAKYAEAFYNCDSATLLKNEGLPWSHAPGLRPE